MAGEEIIHAADPSRVEAGRKAAETRRLRREAALAGVAAPVVGPAPVKPVAVPVEVAAVPAVVPAAASSVSEAEAREALVKLEKSLNAAFPERREVIRGLLLAVLGRQHALLLGPPGTAKSLLIETLSEALALTRFEKLLTAYTDPSELFGPLDVAALKEGKRRTIITGMAPTAQVVVLDEIFKANSSILNSLLALINERKFHDGSSILRCPLVSLFGASNEGPADDSLAALYDRLFLRFHVDYLSSDDNLRRIFRAGKPKVMKLAAGVIEAAQAGVLGVEVSEECEDAVLAIRAKLKEENIVVSDRRWVQSRVLIQAAAWLDGEPVASPEHAAFLADALWNEKEERTAVKRVVLALTNSVGANAQEIVEAARESVEQVRRYAGYDRGLVVAQGATANAKIDEMVAKLNGYLAKASKRQRGAIEAALAEVATAKAELVSLLKHGAAVEAK